ncbi:MAG TPA: zf-HC2 domain-containing protein [Sphingomicrobium sp.]|nr:zf-HC2 domain-containing protein [Sphingomicrobium sp.]
MADSTLSQPSPHDDAEELLPWYATGQLDPADRLKVERHLYSCALCRRQLKAERRLAQRVQAMSPQIDAGWARLKARLESRRTRSAIRPSFLSDLRSLMSRPAVAAVAAAQLAFVILAGGLLVSLTRPDYHALGSAPEPTSANAIVMFRAEATEKDMRTALESAGASIVGGPTAADAYLIHVDTRGRSAALVKLKADGVVTMAEAIDGAGP